MSRFFSHPDGKGLFGLFNDSFPPILDGVTLTVENYAHWLDKKSMTPCVVTPWNPEKGNYPYGVMRYFSLPIQSRHPYRYGYPKFDPFIWKRLRATDFSLVHAHCPFSSGRLAVYVKKHQKVPLIGTFHSKYRSDLEHSFRLFPWGVKIIMKRILDFFNSCDEVWIPQAQVEETVREYGYKGKLTVVENGNDFASAAGDDILKFREDSRKYCGISSDEIALLFVGQHIWEKGLDTVIETLGAIKDKVRFKMNFIGTGYAFNEIRDRISAMGLQDCVRLHGVIKERDVLARYYAASDLFLFPSFYDNAPLVVREAAAMATPSVLLKGSTASEIIGDGKNGFLVEKDSGQMAQLIRSLADDRDRLTSVGNNARATLVRSWENVVEEVADRYRILVKLHQQKGGGR